MVMAKLYDTTDEQYALFLSSALHEMRSPLSSLKILNYMIRKKPQNLDQYLKELEERTAFLQQMVEDMFDISCMQHGAFPMDMQHCNFSELVSLVANELKPVAEQREIVLATDLPEEQIYIYGDPHRLMQVITNLVQNAIQYTLPSGEVHIRLRKKQFSQSSENFGLLEVQDTGIGIEEEHLSHIFEPFYRVSNGTRGTGLGLGVVKQIVERHQGHISIKSTYGIGSAFSILLPLNRNSQASRARV